VFHCIIFPTILKAEGSYILPDNVPANEFLNLENGKISTSKNWAVWLHEYLIDFNDKQDVLRYVLTANAPETKDNDFTWKDFQARNNNELVAIFGNFVNRTITLTHSYFEGKTPSPGTFDDFDNETLSNIALIVKNVEDAIEHFKFREAMKEAMNLARLGNKYLADTEPWKLIKTDKEKTATILYVTLQITANLAILMEPFLPFSAKKLRNMINMSDVKWNLCGQKDILKPGHFVEKPQLLFDKIEDEAIQKQIDRLERIKAANEAAAKPSNPAKPNISYDDFTKMDIRIGTVLEAEKVPKTNKLLKLKIDTGIDKRTVVS